MKCKKIVNLLAGIWFLFVGAAPLLATFYLLYLKRFDPGSYMLPKGLGDFYYNFLVISMFVVFFIHFVLSIPFFLQKKYSWLVGFIWTVLFVILYIALKGFPINQYYVIYILISLILSFTSKYFSK